MRRADLPPRAWPCRSPTCRACTAPRSAPSLVRIVLVAGARGTLGVALRRRQLGRRRPRRRVPGRSEHRRRRARHVGEHLRPDLRARRNDAARHRQREPVDRPRSCSPTPRTSCCRRTRRRARCCSSSRSSCRFATTAARRCSGRRRGTPSWAARASATGLKMARLALKRAHVQHGAILLVSDLDDSNADQGAARAGGAPAARRAHPGSDRAALRSTARPAPLRRALRRQRVRRPERLHAHREAARRGGRRAAAVAAASPRRAPRRPARRRTSAGTAGSPSGRAGMKTRLRRHRSAVARAAARVRRASSSALLAADVRTWQTTVARDDLRFRALPAHRGLWRPATMLPGDPAALADRHRRHDRVPPRAAVLLVQPHRQQPRGAAGHADAARAGAAEAPWA